MPLSPQAGLEVGSEVEPEAVDIAADIRREDAVFFDRRRIVIVKVLHSRIADIIPAQSRSTNQNKLPQNRFEGRGRLLGGRPKTLVTSDSLSRSFGASVANLKVATLLSIELSNRESRSMTALSAPPSFERIHCVQGTNLRQKIPS
jgi:hypothetical protein